MVAYELREMRQEDGEFKASLSYTGRSHPYLKTKEIILLYTENTQHTHCRLARVQHTHCGLARVQHTWDVLPMHAEYALTSIPAGRLPVYTAQNQVPPVDQVRMFTKRSRTH